ncbi:MAG: metalloprotease TldD [Gammaproteobacteria bacterium]|nr:metalloprotease TldD [Gammaproteobacteria bacterium]
MDSVQQQLLAPNNIDEGKLDRVLGGMLGPQIDYADLYFQVKHAESWKLEDSIVKSGSQSLNHGVGARAVSGEKSGFAFSDALQLPALTQASNAAKAIARQGADTQGVIQTFADTSTHDLYRRESPIESWADEKKVALLQDIDRYIRDQDERVREVTCTLSASHENILVAATDGTFSADIRPLVVFRVEIIIEQDGRRESGYSGGGGRYDLDTLVSNDQVKTFADEALRVAQINLTAKPAPAGLMTVVLGSGWPGILLHEAIGHGLEGDFNRKGTSAFSGRIGERVATDLCTVVDQGDIDARRGSLNIDDEGTPTQETVLIENGILKGYMQDKLNARLMGTQPTGNGRRESYAHLPMPRMTNTYMKPGPHSHDEIIASVKNGLYAEVFGGGQVDITSGKFVFDATQAYLIENGKVTKPVKGAVLIGDGPELLTKVSMVGNNLELDKGLGTCGKDGQSVPVGVGQPSLKIDEITVGGTG